MSEWVEAQLGSVSFAMKLMPDADFGLLEYVDEETDNIWADINTQLTRRASKLRHVNFAAKYDGRKTGKDALIAWENDLRRELLVYPNTLVVQPSNASLSTTYTVLRNPALDAPFDYAYDKLDFGIFAVSLVCEPWGYGDTEHIGTGSYESPTLIDLGTLIGQGDPPLTVDIARAWGSANDGIGIEHAIVALAQTEAAIGAYVWDAKDHCASPWSVTADASKCASGYFAKLSAHDGWHYVDIDASGTVPAGRYRVFARCKTSSTTGDNYVGLRKQAVGDRDPKSKTLVKTGDVWALYDMGELAIYVGFGAVRIYGLCGSGWFGLDRMYLVPIDFAWMRYDDTAQTSGAVHFGWLYDQLYALTDGSAPAFDATGRMFGHGLKCGLEGFSLMVIVEAMNGDDPTPDFTLDATYRPRWESFRDE